MLGFFQFFIDFFKFRDFQFFRKVFELFWLNLTASLVICKTWFYLFLEVLEVRWYYMEYMTVVKSSWDAQKCIILVDFHVGVSRRRRLCWRENAYYLPEKNRSNEATTYH